MNIKVKGIRVSKKLHIEIDKRCNEHYMINQPERLNPENEYIHLPAEHFSYIAMELRKKCPCKTCKMSKELENSYAIV